MAWLEANWKEILLVLLAVDAVLVPIFPNAGILASIKQLLTNLTSPPAA